MMISFTNKVFHQQFFVTNYKNSNVIICGVDVNDEFVETIEQKRKPSVFFLTEPINNFPNSCYTNSLKLFNSNKFDLTMGCIEHNPKSNLYKFPLYLFENNFNMNDTEQFNNVNKMVGNITYSELNEKKFCVLINSWDKNTRTVIYKKVKTIGDITCPGKLFNNCSNVTLNQVGKKKYINQFLFNICSENFDTNNINGYITEKLMDCCLSGAIPIYTGWFDDYDEKIFNKDRILFYNSEDESSQIQLVNKLEQLLSDKQTLLEFYNQPVFCNTAYDTIHMLKIELDTAIKRLS